jgi:hypothetical protein
MKKKETKPRKGWQLWIEGGGPSTVYHGTSGEKLLVEAARLSKMSGKRVYALEGIWAMEPDGKIIDLSRLS